jgi:hypothetical protein
MLPRFSSPGGGRRNPNLARLFVDAPSTFSSNSTYGRALASPANPNPVPVDMIGETTNEGRSMVQWTGKNNLSFDELKRACGLPEAVAEFILNVSVDDLRDPDNGDDEADTNNQALVPSTNTANTLTVSPPNGQQSHATEYHLFWPSLLRPRAIIPWGPEPSPPLPSPSRELILWRTKPALTTLPSEIRLHIYSFLLTRRNPPRTQPTPPFRFTPRLPSRSPPRRQIPATNLPAHPLRTPPALRGSLRLQAPHHRLPSVARPPNPPSGPSTLAALVAPPTRRARDGRARHEPRAARGQAVPAAVLPDARPLRGARKPDDRAGPGIVESRAILCEGRG